MALVYTRKTLRGQNAVLLVFSLIFYAWSGPALLLLLLAMTFICWLAGRTLGSVRVPFYRRAILFMTVATCLFVFGFFKYSDFFASTLQSIFRFDAVLPDILLPVGISFYTFQLLSYVADVYRREVEPQKNYLTLLLYAALFHQCVAGPIVRYSDVEAELLDRSVRLSDISAGITRFSLGLGKKAILANYCGSLADAALSAEALASASSGTVFLGTVFYMLQIYLDFSAYSDMAIGMGLMCGLHYCENFNYPYCADSATDFWRRWHISLSTLFRDYVYIPLGGNRRGTARTYVNLWTVFLLTGIWHGAGWTFIFWGIYHGFFNVLERCFLGKWLKQEKFRPLAHIYAVFVVLIGWIFFRADTIGQAFSFIRYMFVPHSAVVLMERYMNRKLWMFLAAALLACGPVQWFWMKWKGRVLAQDGSVTVTSWIGDGHKLDRLHGDPVVFHFAARQQYI